ncbi:hypothetical protein SARC_05193 [Sphaeroforma arctica JP610]|uniref:Uncharacterized protein n=1 Tax=Sphaeroforma arctica JP610 TaxID=667725 RepID=A0A0L0G0C6_9EUKA|nr:hypothetical protein SARC_05193 [Sphaeroforma arctica JP610]KNC82520.1 hypothetical protein SARC_05193 [Sphaeroforma arctica JP610]|eukprot:XP_014156422.1 hypothetical protein SARC_05193 [Sphaeroforma arctica JP610]
MRSPKAMKATHIPRMGLDQEITRVMCELDELIFNEETKATQPAEVTEIRGKRKALTQRLHGIASNLDKVVESFKPVKEKMDQLQLSVTNCRSKYLCDVSCVVVILNKQIGAIRNKYLVYFPQGALALSCRWLITQMFRVERETEYKLLAQ